jgi:hypothetical protein
VAVIVTMAVAITVVIRWLRGERWWSLRPWAHIHRVFHQALKGCNHRWDVSHKGYLLLPLPRQHADERSDKQEHKYRDHDDQHTTILLSYILSTHTLPFLTTV